MHTYPAAISVPSTSGLPQSRSASSRRPGRARNWFAAWRDVRRLNRAYRRQRQGFERALGQVSASPAAQQELYAIWTRG